MSEIDPRPHAAAIVAAYVSNHRLSPDELPSLIKAVAAALVGLPSTEGTGPSPEAQQAREPAVAPNKSVFRDYIICLEDGKRLKMLKRHLNTTYGLTPEQYRAKWNLPSNYPMVAPAYADVRRELAISIGLGTSDKTPNPRNTKKKTGGKVGRPRRVVEGAAA